MSPGVPGLSGCLFDAGQIHNAFRDIGIPDQNIIILKNEDAHRRGILDALKLLAAMEEVSEVIFYFAGHGCSIDGSNFLVPWDGQLVKNGAMGSCISIRESIDGCCGDSAKPVVLLVDACRRGFFSANRQIRPFFCSEQLVKKNNLGSFKLLLSSPAGISGNYSSGSNNGSFAGMLSEVICQDSNWQDGRLAFENVYQQVASQMVVRSAERYFTVCNPSATSVNLIADEALITEVASSTDKTKPRVSVALPWPTPADCLGQTDNGRPALLGLDVPPDTALLVYCIKLIESGSYPEARDAILEYPGWEQNRLLLTAMGISLRMLNQYEPARKYLARALKHDPGCAAVHLSLGNVLLLMKEFTTAEHHYRQAIRLDENYSQAHYGLGTLYAHQHKFTTALVHYLKALELNPCWPMTHSGLGFIYHKLGRVELAISEYEEAVLLDPHCYYTYYGLGRAMKAIGQMAAAEESFRECLRLNPGLAAGCYELGELLRVNGRSEEALIFFKQALDLDIGYMPTHLGLASLEAADGQIEAALVRLDSALALDPSFARTHALLAELNLGLGRHSPAKRHARLAASLSSPEDEEYANSQRVLDELAKA